MYSDTGYDEKKYWGGFAKNPPDLSVPLPDWAIGPFDKYEHNPIFSPSATGWDIGRFGGGVHKGAIIRKDGQFFYVYRGGEELSTAFWDDANPESTNLGSIDYICDIGIAVSDDGINVRRAAPAQPFVSSWKRCKIQLRRRLPCYSRRLMGCLWLFRGICSTGRTLGSHFQRQKGYIEMLA